VCSVSARAQAPRVLVSADSVWGVASTADAALDTLAARGFLLARVDSLTADSVFVTPGPRATVRSLAVVGASGLNDLTRDWATRQGTPFSMPALVRDLTAAAARYASAGFVDARLVPAVEVVDGGQAVDISVQITEGDEALVTAVELAGARTPSRAFATRRAGLGAPTPPSKLSLSQIQERLASSGLYAEVGPPILARDADGALVVQVPVVEAPPGAFDVVLGYLPPEAGRPGGVVGSGRVDLRNLFGGGRAATVQLDRTPGLASSCAVSFADPFVLGTALGAGLSFEGSSRDSTLSRQRLAADVRYALDPTLDLVASLASEAVRPGTFGAQEVGGRPRVRRTDDLFVGVGIVLTRLDRPRNPRRGVALEVLAEQGRRRGDGLQAGGQRRLTVGSRGYLPTLARQAAVVGVEATVTQQAAGLDGLVDEGDLVRFGGASSFRGYDEDALLARSYARVTAEYRVLFDEVSYGFAFADAGGLDRPAVPGVGAERRGLLGYGAGLRLATGVGLATITYALNPDLSAGRGKVHVGLTLGL